MKTLLTTGGIALFFGALWRVGAITQATRIEAPHVFDYGFNMGMAAGVSLTLFLGGIFALAVIVRGASDSAEAYERGAADGHAQRQKAQERRDYERGFNVARWGSEDGPSHEQRVRTAAACYNAAFADQWVEAPAETSGGWEPINDQRITALAKR